MNTSSDSAATCEQFENVVLHLVAEVQIRPIGPQAHALPAGGRIAMPGRMDEQQIVLRELKRAQPLVELLSRP